MILNRIIASFFLTKGKSSLSRGDMLSALNFFKKCEKYEQSYDIFIYKGVAEFFLKEIENSIISLQYALQLVENNTKLTENEKSYLKYYTLDFLIKSLKIMGTNKNLEQYEKNFKRLVFDKKQVRKRFLEWFPI